MPRPLDRCRLCGNPELISLLDLGEQTLTGVFPRDPRAPVTRGPLELVKCHGPANACHLVQLGHSYDSAELYGGDYGYRSSLNASMVRHLGAKVDRLLARQKPVAGDLVLDIGSNDGTLLRRYPSELCRVGMDPTIAKLRDHYPSDILAIEDFFSAEAFRRHAGNQRASIVTSISTLR